MYKQTIKNKDDNKINLDYDRAERILRELVNSGYGIEELIMLLRGFNENWMKHSRINKGAK